MCSTLLWLVLITTVSGQREGDPCEDQLLKSAGICKPVNQCETAIRDFEQSSIRPTFCSESLFGGALVCCRDGLTIFEAPANTAEDVPTWGIVTSENKKRVSERKCEEYNRDWVPKVEIQLLLLEPEVVSIPIDNCYGRTASLPGELAAPGQFPHMVAIGSKQETNPIKFVCGGSLISDKFVLTAAQCTWPSRKENHVPNIVRLGDQNLDSSISDGATPLDVSIVKLHSHPYIKPPRKYHDIALVELAEAVAFSFTIRPACIWPNFGGYDKVIATGWNILNYKKTEQERELEKVLISSLERTSCTPMHNRNWPEFNSSNICAGELKESWHACLNEAGSPLQVVSRDNKCTFHVVGITSFGPNCKNSKLPSVYTNVANYVDWIEQIVWPGNY